MMEKFVKRVEIDDLNRGDFVVVRWRDASNIRGKIEEFGETTWVKDWGFCLGIMGEHPQLILTKDVTEGQPTWGVTRIPIDLIEEIWLWIPSNEAKQVIPKLRTKKKRIMTRRFNREEYTEEYFRNA